MDAYKFSSFSLKSKIKLLLCIVTAVFLGIYAFSDMKKLIDCCRSVTENQAPLTILADDVETKIKPFNFESTQQEGLLVREVILTRSNEIKDIEVDGRVNVNSQGQLIYDRELRDLFDFYIGLTVSIEELPSLKLAIQQYLRKSGYDENITSDVLEALNHYLRYRESAIALDSFNVNDIEIGRLFDELYNLRRIHLGNEMADGFYHEEEASNRYLVERQKLYSQASSMTIEEKNRQLELLQDQLPLAQNTARHQAIKIASASKEVAQLNQQGASNTEIYQVREELLGSEAAQRLYDLDEKRKQWNEKFSQYTKDKNKLIVMGQLNDDQLSVAVEDLRQQYFSGNELLRISALEKMN